MPKILTQPYITEFTSWSCTVHCFIVLSSSKMANITLVLESSLKLIPSCSRSTFFWLILTISVVALIGNILAIRSIISRKQRCLQKVCIICLSIADIFSTIMFGINNLDALSRELKIWKLGKFLCHFIPMGQVLGTTASSIALLVIALDRYQNVTVAIISERWNPSVCKCITVIFLCLLLCSLTSYPMYIFFTFNPIEVVHTDTSQLILEDAYLCAAINKDKLKQYYLIMAVVVFFPIALIFIWFYYQIAALVWRHRKPFISKYQDSKMDISVSSVSIPKLETKRIKTAQVQRKIRTFKVIIVLMLAFIICRLPYWIYFVIKLVETIGGSTMWYLNFTFTALNMLNCAVNPLLYAFLNQTIYATRKCHDIGCKIALYCCYCNTKDFTDLHNNSPFVIDVENKKEVRGKGKHLNNCRIKFDDVAHIKTHMCVDIPPSREQLI